MPLPPPKVKEDDTTPFQFQRLPATSGRSRPALDGFPSAGRGVVTRGSPYISSGARRRRHAREHGLRASEVIPHGTGSGLKGPCLVAPLTDGTPVACVIHSNAIDLQNSAT